MLQVLLRLCLIGILLYGCSCRSPGLIKDLLLFLAVGNLITVPFTFVVLHQRLQEIETGELDEARKY